MLLRKKISKYQNISLLIRYFGLKIKFIFMVTIDKMITILKKNHCSKKLLTYNII